MESLQKCTSKFPKFQGRPQIGVTWPAPITHLQLFLAHLFERNYASKTASTYLSAISYHHKVNNITDTTQAFSVTSPLQGFQRLRSSTDTRQPIMYELLVKIHRNLGLVCYNEYETLLFQTAFSTAFFGLFRVSELAFTADDMWDRPLFLSDVNVTSQMLTIRLRKSKTNQSGKAQTIQVSPVGTEVCPVKLMLSYLKARKSANSIYLFCHENGSALSRYQFGAVLSKILKTLQGCEGSYRTHSFRIGAVSWLASKGIDHDTIKRMGRWSSKAFFKYIRL